MAKLILGIIAAACIHMGFVAFMANDRTIESAKLVIESAQEMGLDTSEVIAPAPLSVYDEPAVTVATVPGPVLKIYVPVYITRRVEVAARSYIPVRERRPDASVKLQPSSERNTFEARMTEPRPNKSLERSEAAQRDLIYELATMNDRKTEKRSFVASNVVPVVRKPWELIKSIGGKLR